jgi:hypothetical protein
VAVIQRAAQGTPARPAQGNTPAIAAVQGDWKAAAFILERKWPQNWGRRFNLEHTGKDGGPIQQQHSYETADAFPNLSSDQQLQLYDLLTLAEVGAVGGPDDGA